MRLTKKIAILFSGNGSNLEALIKVLHNKRFIKSDKKFQQREGFLIGGIENEFLEVKASNTDSFRVEVVLALSNKSDAYGLKRAENLGVKTCILESKAYEKREDFDGALVEILQKEKIDLCVLAGFMRILTPIFTKQIKAINIHPSLLPLFKGAHGIKESFESKMKLGGVSVHFVNDELDGGEIIAQGVLIKNNESLEEYEQRVHSLEHFLYPLAVMKVLKGDF